jgi:gluconokinase
MRSDVKIVFMGVCGCGKTTLAERTAQYLGCDPVYEADMFHPAEMKEKMRSGVPLTDEDRWPWLEKLNGAIRESGDETIVMTCSALRKVYRERLLKGVEDKVVFFFLDAPEEVIFERVSARKHEYMPVSLLGSQFETLERPQEDEPVKFIPVSGTEDETFEHIKSALASL